MTRSTSPGAPRLIPPPRINLHRTLREIAQDAGVCINTAYRWRKEAGIWFPRGRRPGETAP